MIALQPRLVYHVNFVFAIPATEGRMKFVEILYLDINNKN